MKQQEGYIELDGKAVSEAAKKAYDIEKQKDEEYNKTQEEKARPEREAFDYFHSPDAEIDFRQTYESCKVEKVREVEERGWFFTYTSQEKYWSVDEEKLAVKLAEKNKHWEGRDLLNTIYYYKCHNHFSCPRLGYPSMWRTWRYEAPYYEQFFDLNGRVFLTLEQYSKLKEYME